MKSNHQINGLCVFALVASFVSNIVAAPLGTVFTYQGRLNDGTNPATGKYDFTFKIYDALASGSVVAGPLTNTATSVTNGLFMVALDFGAVFNGEERWLEIGVRTNGVGGFANLAQRQALHPIPYALYAMNAGLAGNYTNSVTISNQANIFVGTNISVSGNVSANTSFINTFLGNPVFSGEPVITGGSLALQHTFSTNGTSLWTIENAFSRVGVNFTNWLLFRGGSGIVQMLLQDEPGGGIVANNITATGVFTGNGSGLTNLPSVSAVPRMRVYTNSGTFVVTNGPMRVMVEVWGGGGGGSYGGGSGGGGGYGKQVFELSSGTYDVIVGAGGASGPVSIPPAPPTPGSAGGASSFGGLITAHGGGGGSSLGTGGAGGNSTGDFNLTGDVGGSQDSEGGNAAQGGFGGRGRYWGLQSPLAPSEPGGGGLAGGITQGQNGAKGRVVVYY